MVWSFANACPKACLAAVMMFSLTGCAAKYVDFGEPSNPGAGQAIEVARILAQPDAYDGKFLRVKGAVASVCAKKGCWLRMGGEGVSDTVFVKFTCPVDGRLIPMDAVDHDVVVEGTVKVETTSQADARHYAEDAGKSPEEIAKIVGGQQQVRMMAPTARIYGMSE